MYYTRTMLCNTIDYYIFLFIVFLVYCFTPSKIKIYWLLISSFIYILLLDKNYWFLALMITFISYLGGLFLSRKKTNSQRKIALIILIFLIVLPLMYFKYYLIIKKYFFMILGCTEYEEISSMYFTKPVGLSFYTFAALSYVVDVYNNPKTYEKSIINFSAFMLYFPKFVEGPIEKANKFSCDNNKKRISINKIYESFLFISWGLFQKIVIADRISIFVDTVYSDINIYNGYYLIIAALLYSIQIYCDFSGYSSIAIGVSKLFGIDLIRNFECPYFSKSVSEFWRRWHISLSNWLRDYIYLPLGGNKKGIKRKCLNIVIVFLISGIWHGSSLSFIVWGLLNAIYQIVGYLFKPTKDRIIKSLNVNIDSFLYKAFSIITTYILVCVSWVFFRADRFLSALSIIKSILTSSNIIIIFDGSLLKCGLDIKNMLLLIICIVFLILIDILEYKNINLCKKINNWHWAFKCIFTVFIVCFLMTFGKYGPALDKASFIYSNF